MIPQELSRITWDDLQRLVDTEREEDDTIEFKEAFKGGVDYLGLNDKGREQAVDALAREVLAFLNTRGGDLIVGIRESKNGAAVATEVVGISNAAEVADRIARALAALIEPAQTEVGVRAILRPQQGPEGAIVIRVHPSIRAPHRSKRTRDAFARRGSESVPMAMDEIQELTLNKSRIRLEQLDLLARQFAGFEVGEIHHHDLGEQFLHIRTVAFPLSEQVIGTGDDVLNALRNRNPVVYDSTGRGDQFSVPFRGLYSRWRPIVRGRMQEDFQEYIDPRADFPTKHFASRSVKESGICTFDYAHLADLNGTGGVYAPWIAGYLAEICEGLRELWQLQPNLLPSVLRIGIRVEGEVWVAYPTGWSDDIRRLHQGSVYFPDYSITEIGELDEFFRQSQVDFYSLFNIDLPKPFTLVNPNQYA